MHTDRRFNLLDHTMCKSVESYPPYKAVDRTKVFSLGDTAMSWLHFGGPICGTHVIRWDWIDYDGFLFTSHYEKIDPEKHGLKRYEYYTLSSALTLHSEQWVMERMNKTLKVEVFFDNVHIATETWSIGYRPHSQGR